MVTRLNTKGLPYIEPPPALPEVLSLETLRPLVDERLEDTDTSAIEERADMISALMQETDVQVDALQIALQRNHANYLHGRGSWPYDIRIEVEERMRQLKRQRVRLQPPKRTPKILVLPNRDLFVVEAPIGKVRI